MSTASADSTPSAALPSLKRRSRGRSRFGSEIRPSSSQFIDIPEAILDKEDITAKLTALIEAGHGVAEEWITDDELAAQPDLVKTMSVKPPVGMGRVRLLRIGGGVDLQPCGGTHLKSTAEVGAVRIGKVEKKGKRNRRVNIHLDD